MPAIQPAAYVKIRSIVERSRDDRGRMWGTGVSFTILEHPPLYGEGPVCNELIKGRSSETFDRFDHYLVAGNRSIGCKRLSGRRNRDRFSNRFGQIAAHDPSRSAVASRRDLTRVSRPRATIRLFQTIADLIFQTSRPIGHVSPFGDSKTN